MTLGAGIDTIVTTANTATTALTAGGAAVATGVAIGDVFTLNSDEVVISDFAAGVGGDRANMANTGVNTGAIGAGALATGTFAVSGTYSAANSTFTAAATNTAGADTLLVPLPTPPQHTAGTDTLVLTR